VSKVFATQDEGDGIKGYCAEAGSAGVYTVIFHSLHK